MASFAIPVADFNGDGNLDIALDDNLKTINNIAIRLGNGNGTFSIPSIYDGIDRNMGLVAADITATANPIS